jgi:hypothetical protein
VPIQRFFEGDGCPRAKMRKKTGSIAVQLGKSDALPVSDCPECNAFSAASKSNFSFIRQSSIL